MANWCLNTVKFEADEPVYEKIRVLFLEMAQQEILTNKGQLPSFCNLETGYLFEIDWQDDELFYLTKWSPNFDVLIAVAAHFGVCFQYQYQETAMGIYGMAVYLADTLCNVYLEPKDFTFYSYCEQSHKYEFEGQQYALEFEILDILLQRKVNRIYNR